MTIFYRMGGCNLEAQLIIYHTQLEEFSRPKSEIEVCKWTVSKVTDATITTKGTHTHTHTHTHTTCIIQSKHVVVLITLSYNNTTCICIKLV